MAISKEKLGMITPSCFVPDPVIPIQGYKALTLPNVGVKQIGCIVFLNQKMPRQLGTVFVNADLSTYIRFLNWMPAAMKMPEPVLIEHAGFTLRYMSASIFLGEHDIHLSQFSHCTIAFLFFDKRTLKRVSHNSYTTRKQLPYKRWTKI